MTRARYAPISDPDITEYNGLRWSAGAAAGALPEPASSRAAHPVPPCPLRTILTSNDPPENGKTGFLKFLALRCSARRITSRALASRGRARSRAAGVRLAVAAGRRGPVRR